NPAGKALDWANVIARWSLIYTNPAYIPFNFLANNFFLLAQQGPQMLRSWQTALNLLKNDEALRIQVGGEVGELPATALISTGRGMAKVKDWEHRFLTKYLSKYADAWPRMVAWVYEAGKLGYRTAEEMRTLIKGATERDRHNREMVADRATKIMVDFDAQSD